MSSKGTKRRYPAGKPTVKKTKPSKAPPKKTTKNQDKASNSQNKDIDESNPKLWQEVLEHSEFDDFWKSTIEVKIKGNLSNDDKKLLDKISKLNISDFNDP